MFSLMHITCLWSLQNQNSAIEDFIPCVSADCGFLFGWFFLIPCLSVIRLWLFFRVSDKSTKQFNFFQVWTSGLNQYRSCILTTLCKVKFTLSGTFKDLRTVLIFIATEFYLLMTLINVYAQLNQIMLCLLYFIFSCHFPCKNRFLYIQYM